MITTQELLLYFSTSQEK